MFFISKRILCVGNNLQVQDVKGTTDVSLIWYNNTLSRLICQNETIWNLYKQMANESDQTPLAAFQNSMAPFVVQVHTGSTYMRSDVSDGKSLVLGSKI